MATKDFEHHVKNSDAMVYWTSIQRMLCHLMPSTKQEHPYGRSCAVQTA